MYALRPTNTFALLWTKDQTQTKQCKRPSTQGALSAATVFEARYVRLFQVACLLTRSIRSVKASRHSLEAEFDTRAHISTAHY
jgi:hypothetical protein